MCTTNIYTYVRPDGRKEQYQTPTLCSASRSGVPCANNVVFQHPNQYVPYADPHASTSGLAPSPYLGQQLPPTPTYTPRSGTPIYRSGDESDRSYHSASSASKQRRPSGVYVNGQKILDLYRRDRGLTSSGRRSGERIVLVESPPTPRTPPQLFSFPHTAPSSPNAPAYSNPSASSSPVIVDAPYTSHRRSSMSHRRPVIVDERLATSTSRRSKHDRHASTSSHESRHSSSSIEEKELKRIRKQQREGERIREQEEIREVKLQTRIARANAEINNRPAVPMPPVFKRSSTATYARPSAASSMPEANIVEAMRHVSFDDDSKQRRRAEKAERKEEEAQRQRLIERMMPKRRATVGPGSRRHRVLYDDGMYRWE